MTDKNQRDPNLPTRRGDDVFCPMHESQVSKNAEMKGMMTILIGVVSAFALTGLCICGSMLWLALGIDKTFSNYIASHTVEARGEIIKIAANRTDIDENDKDILLLFAGHRDQQKELDDTKKRVSNIEKKILLP